MPADDSHDEGTDQAATAPATTSMTFRAGYSLESLAGPRGDVLSIKAPDGKIFLKISLLPEGPAVELQSVSLAVAASGDLSLDCRRLAIHAEDGVAIRTGGDLVQVAQGDVRVAAGGVIDTEGHAQHLRARRGDVQLTANDDVALDGERVRLNSPKAGLRPREALQAQTPGQLEPKR
ncbi:MULTISPECIES: hypothetical protein [Nannocystis]|uniref:DUF2345 domain-containing protein n=1 Tax=Nannocystis radixulma TaxID=2995305 RepID=A0ABT5BBX2_9BACT|nr:MULTISPECIES: hypothetical protein [Nannocystis]MCY1060896.1 hypothetical protein [Nannocystis sp. SCPEA4]MDC0671626.1 hypothetical protein [Nannocystis radixulma]